MTNPADLFSKNKHLVLFLDFLGFSEATTKRHPDRGEQLLSLLREAKSLTGQFAFRAAQLEGGPLEVDITPEVSAFSDNLIASIPLSRSELAALQKPARSINGLASHIYIQSAVGRLQWMASRLARRALEFRMLIRGGLTIGDLHHSEGIVFGEGLIDAYRLEKDVAIYPRIAVSGRLHRLSIPGLSMPISTDHDGIRHMNYLQHIGYSPSGKIDSTWTSDMARVISEEITKLEKKELWSQAAKWSWLKANLFPNLRET